LNCYLTTTTPTTTTIPQIVTAAIRIVEIAKSTANILNPINILIKSKSEEMMKSTTDVIEFTNNLNEKNKLETVQSESQILNNNQINSQTESTNKIDNQTDINLSIINENIEFFENETDIFNSNNSDIEEETPVIKLISTSSTFLFSEMTTSKPAIYTTTTRIKTLESIISSSPFTYSNLIPNSTISLVNIQSSTKPLEPNIEPIIVSILLAYLFLNYIIYYFEGLEYQYLLSFHKNYYLRD
jgi:hypothetical protein